MANRWLDSEPLEVEIVAGSQQRDLTARERMKIREAFRSGERRKAIAARYGVSEWTVWRVGR